MRSDYKETCIIVMSCKKYYQNLDQYMRYKSKATMWLSKYNNLQTSKAIFQFHNGSHDMYVS